MERVFIGTEALARGDVNRYELGKHYRRLLPDVYGPRSGRLTLGDRTAAAWLWSGREGVIAGLAASAAHGAKWVDADVPIELVAPMAGVEDAPVMSRLRRGGGMDHLCFVVDDVAAALAEESDRGGLVVCEPVFAVAFTRTIGFVQRRSGLVVEYISKEEVSSP